MVVFVGCRLERHHRLWTCKGIKMFVWVGMAITEKVSHCVNLVLGGMSLRRCQMVQNMKHGWVNFASID